jgi:hypothetical protein
LFTLRLNRNAIKSEVDCGTTASTFPDYSQSSDLGQESHSIAKAMLKEPFEQISLFTRQRTVNWSNACALLDSH